jgi:hypothetical protein
MINDEIEGQMAIVDITMVPRDQVLWPAVIMLAGRRFRERVSETPCILPPQLNARPLMDERSLIVACEDVPLDEARRMSRGPRMDPDIHHALKQNICSGSV